mmetsp:Transcript_28912/g.88803  ORF Transcript_28912/g.88803 Transcript_28912/m.88803 type:complete len:116 (+) Transcript_28912:1131-1478(+)
MPGHEQRIAWVQLGNKPAAPSRRALTQGIVSSEGRRILVRQTLWAQAAGVLRGKQEPPLLAFHLRDHIAAISVLVAWSSGALTAKPESGSARRFDVPQKPREVGSASVCVFKVPK